MDVKFTYDWISATGTKENLFYLGTVFDLGERVGKSNKDARHGYNCSEKFETGVVTMWHDSEDRMGMHVVLSGSALRALTAKGFPPDFVLRELKRLSCRCSRIDLAIDLYQSSLKMVNFYESERLPYKGKGRTPQITPVGTDMQGFTIYVGSRSSDKFLRIYDKAKEQKDFTSDYKRIELECKGAVAHWLGDALPEKTTMEGYELASSIIKTMVNFSSPQWAQALASNTVEFSTPKPSARDTYAWLIKSCAPALARVVAENPSKDVLNEFARALRDELAKYGIDAI